MIRRRLRVHGVAALYRRRHHAVATVGPTCSVLGLGMAVLLDVPRRRRGEGLGLVEVGRHAYGIELAAAVEQRRRDVRLVLAHAVATVAQLPPACRRCSRNGEGEGEGKGEGEGESEGEAESEGEGERVIVRRLDWDLGEGRTVRTSMGGPR